MDDRADRIYGHGTSGEIAVDAAGYRRGQVGNSAYLNRIAGIGLAHGGNKFERDNLPSVFIAITDLPDAGGHADFYWFVTICDSLFGNDRR